MARYRNLFSQKGVVVNQGEYSEKASSTLKLGISYCDSSKNRKSTGFYTDFDCPPLWLLQPRDEGISRDLRGTAKATSRMIEAGQKEKQSQSRR